MIKLHSEGKKKNNTPSKLGERGGKEEKRKRNNYGKGKLHNIFWLRKLKKNEVTQFNTVNARLLMNTIREIMVSN